LQHVVDVISRDDSSPEFTWGGLHVWKFPLQYLTVAPFCVVKIESNVSYRIKNVSKTFGSCAVPDRLREFTVTVIDAFTHCNK